MSKSLAMTALAFLFLWGGVCVSKFYTYTIDTYTVEVVNIIPNPDEEVVRFDFHDDYAVFTFDQLKVLDESEPIEIIREVHYNIWEESIVVEYYIQNEE